ncbi:MAG: AMP-binding protein, partial [Firmicutes bacterium]|nr:AMP-binding protein [Bacillota bacterium]
MEVGKITIGGLVDEMAYRFPESDALVYPFKGIRYNYRQFRDVCNQAAKGFMRLGIKKGEHIAIWANNVPEWVITQFSTGKMGAVLVTVNTNYRTAELEYLLKQSDSTTLILIERYRDSSYIDTIYEIAPELYECQPGQLKSKRLPRLKNVIVLGDRRYPGTYTWNDILAMAHDITEEELPIFHAEAEDQLQILEEGLVQLERKAYDQELVQALFRAAHTLKGSAGMIGHKRMVDLTHALETVLDGVRKQTLDLSSELIDVMLESLDSLHQLLDEVGSDEISPVNVSSIVAQLQRLSGVQSGSTSTSAEIAPTASEQSSKSLSSSEARRPDQPLTIRVKISQDSIASAARALQVVLALQESGEILEL